MRQYFWTTREGKKINVDDMDINHLRNVLKMIIRQVEDRKPKPKEDGILKHFEEEWIKEMEEDQDDQEFDHWH
jgi:hypothetical protein